MWQRTRLKYLAAVPLRNGLGEQGKYGDPEWPRYVRTTDIAGPKSLRDDTRASLPPAVARRASLLSGDIVMTAAGATIGKSLLYSIDEPACYAGYLVRFRPNEETDPRFVAYWMASTQYWSQIEQGKVVSTIENFSASKYANLGLLVPLLEEQQSIADHLDIETDRIDALVSKKRRLLELLETRLVSLAGDVVAGCEEDQMTGIPSMPEIPSSWRVLRNKVFVREVDDRSSDGAGEMLSVSHITGVTPRSEKIVYMFEAESTVGYKLVRPGDLVINTMWAWMGAAGVAEVHGIVSPAYGVYEFDRGIMVPEFFDILIRTPAYVTEMTRFSRGVTSSRLRLYPYEFLRLSSPVPPLDVQREIDEDVSCSPRGYLASTQTYQGTSTYSHESGNFALDHCSGYR